MSEKLELEWLTKDKYDHPDEWKLEEEDECPTAEVILQHGLNYKTMTRQEEYDLFSRWQKYHNPVDRDEFLSRNLRLVYLICKQKARRCAYKPKDLLAWGVMGMIHAFEKYDLTRGAKFSTYAAWWIKQSISRGIAYNSRTIRIPCNIQQDQIDLKKYIKKYIKKFSEEPEDIDICDAFGWTLEKLERVRNGMIPVSSIDLPSSDGENTIADLVRDDKSPDVMAEITNNELRKTILKLIDETCTEREKNVLLNLSGLIENPATDTALAKKYNLTRERIRQIYDESIAKLRHPSRSQELRVFLS